MALYDFLELQGLDIILLQECNLEKRLNYDSIKEFWRGNAAFSGGNDNKCVGVGVLTSKEWDIIEIEELYPGRLLMTKLQKGEQKFKVFCVYAPNEKEERRELFEILRLFILGTEPIIVSGDFNCSLDNDQKRDSSVGVLKDTITPINLKDLWEICGSDLSKKTNMEEQKKRIQD